MFINLSLPASMQQYEYKLAFPVRLGDLRITNTSVQKPNLKFLENMEFLAPDFSLFQKCSFFT